MFGFKKESAISRSNPGFEEDERRTPKTGILLLIVMFVAGVFFGWRALDDVARLPQRPEEISFCADSYRGTTLFTRAMVSPPASAPLYDDSYYDQYTLGGCRFNQLEKDAGIPALIDQRKALSDERQPLMNQYNTILNQLREVRYQIGRITGEYSVGLQESIADVPKPLYPVEQTGATLESLRTQEQSLLAQKTILDPKVKPYEDQLKALDKNIEAAYKPVFDVYNKELRWYEFKVFLLQIIFVLPFFWLAFAWYVRLHRKNSPYTLILTAMVLVATTLFLRVMLFWFWGLFLERVLQIIAEWLVRYQILSSLLFYGGMILSFAVFGGAVYYLQKKIFDPRRVAIRRFRAHQCPKCQASLELSEGFCPNCGYHVKEKCLVCGQNRFVDLPICPHCGSPKT